MEPSVYQENLMKEQRWYTEQDGVIYIHNQPTLEGSQSCSLVYSKEDLKYYRNNFQLRKTWVE